MSISEKMTLQKDAHTRLKKRTDELIDSGEYSLDSYSSDRDTSDTLSKVIPKNKFSSAQRKKLENYLDECRLRREISDDFDL